MQQLGFALALGGIALIVGSCGRSHSGSPTAVAGSGAAAGTDAALDDAAGVDVQDAAAGGTSGRDASSRGGSPTNGGMPNITFAPTQPVWGDSLSTPWSP